MSFFAPFLGVIGTVTLAATPEIDTRRRLLVFCPARLALHPRELAVKSAEDDGLTMSQLFAELEALNKVRAARRDAGPSKAD